MKLKELDTNELRQLIRETVEETIYKLLGDPDEGKKIREEMKERLQSSLERHEQGEIGISHEEVSEQLGLQD